VKDEREMESSERWCKGEGEREFKSGIVRKYIGFKFCCELVNSVKS